jgi:hypothetical protein
MGSCVPHLWRNCNETQKQVAMTVIAWWVIKSLEKKYPNDQELGEAVRKYVRKVKRIKDQNNGKN